MFVIIYTPGPAWLAGKPVREQPFYREHGRYMHQVFAHKRLIIGGPFLDNQGGLGILDVASVAQADEIVAHDPAVLAQFLEAHVHPWHVVPGPELSLRSLMLSGQRGENQAVGHGKDDRDARAW